MSQQTPPLLSDNMLILEQSLLRVPIEAMRRTHRSTSKLTDRELAGVEGGLQKARGSQSREEKLKAVEGALAKLKGFKHKLEDSHVTQKTLVTSSKARITHLIRLNALTSFSHRAYSSWAHVRLQRHLVDYLLRREYVKTAEMLSRDEALNGLVDVELDLFQELRRIEQALREGSAVEALHWCKDNSATLKKSKSNLEFDLRFQEFIELARALKKLEAIQYCKKYLVPSSSATTSRSGLQRIRQAMALLAFGPDTACPPYKTLYNPCRWETLSVTFRRAYLHHYSLPPLPLLNLSLWAGLAGLKMPSCLSPDGKDHNSDCPTCDTTLFGSLAQAPEVPWSHHLNSIIVCKITGKVLAGEDTAYALPNGNIYSGEGLEEIAKSGNGKITCPRSGNEFSWKDLKKVYIT